MARFYQTADRNFIDDFIYEPPMEMAMAVMAKKDEQIKTDLDTMEVLRSLPIDYWKGVDDENATQVKNEWEKRVNDLSQEISGKMLDPSSRAKLMQLRSDFNKDMTSGKIFKLQQNAAAYREFMQKASTTIKDDNARQTYINGYPKQYMESNPEGAYSSIFKPGDMYEFRNVPAEFIKHFREQEKDLFSETMENVNGRWLVKTNTEEAKKIVGDQFKQFVEASPDIKGYLKHRQDSNLFGEKYFGENGELDMTSGTQFEAMDKLVQNESFTHTKTSTEKEANQFALNEQSHQHRRQELAIQNEYQKQAEKRQAAAQRDLGDNSLSPFVASDKNQEWYYNFTPQGREAQASLVNAIRNSVQGMTPDIIAEVNKTPGTFYKRVLDPRNKNFEGTEIRKRFQEINTMYAKQAGESKFAALNIPTKTLELIAAKLKDKKTTNALRTSPGYLNLGQVRSKNITPVTLSQMTGRTINYQGKQYFVKSMDLEENSHYLDPLDMHMSSTVSARLIPMNKKMMNKDQEIVIPLDFEQPNIAGKIGVNINPIISR